MRRSILSCLAALSLLAGYHSAQAQDIVVTKSVGGATPSPINGSPFPANTAIVIDLDPVTSHTDIHIFDVGTSSSPPTRSVGKITINGSLGSPTAQLRVLVAGATSSFPSVLGQAISTPGLVDYGASPADGLIITDPDLRNNTRLAMAVSGRVARSS